MDLFSALVHHWSALEWILTLRHRCLAAISLDSCLHGSAEGVELQTSRWTAKDLASNPSRHQSILACPPRAQHFPLVDRWQALLQLPVKFNWIILINQMFSIWIIKKLTGISIVSDSDFLESDSIFLKTGILPMNGNFLLPDNLSVFFSSLRDE